MEYVTLDVSPKSEHIYATKILFTIIKQDSNVGVFIENLSINMTASDDEGITGNGPTHILASLMEEQ